MNSKNKPDPKKVIVFDADVIIHFISADRLLDLFNIYPNKSVVIDKVYEELAQNKKTKRILDQLTSLGIIQIISFSNRLDIVKEYAHLMKWMNKGKGESACMAYCNFSKDIIASSNLKDTQRYCERHGIEYLTTMDFIVEAYLSESMSLKQCEAFIKKLKDRSHRIPCNTFKEYLQKNGINKTG